MTFQILPSCPTLLSKDQWRHNLTWVGLVLIGFSLVGHLGKAAKGADPYGVLSNIGLFRYAQRIPLHVYYWIISIHTCANITNYSYSAITLSISETG